MKMLVWVGMTLVLLGVCANPVTSLRACGADLTNLLVHHCAQMKRASPGAPPHHVPDRDTDPTSTGLRTLQQVLVENVQSMLDDWRRRSVYEAGVSRPRVRRARRAVTLTSFLDQCCQKGCPLTDLVSVGFC